MKLFYNILLSLLLSGSGYSQNIIKSGSNLVSVGSNLLIPSTPPPFNYTDFNAEAVYLSFEIDTGTDVRKATNQKFVEQWLDLTTNNHDVSQGTTSKQPELILNFFGDKPSVRFDITDDILTRVEANFLSGSPTGTIIVVAGYNASPNEFFTSSDEASNTRFITFGTQDQGGTDVIRLNERNNNTADRVVGDTDLSISGIVILTYESDGATYTIEVNSNDESITIQSGTNSGDWFSSVSARDNITIGALKRSVETYSLGDLAAVLVYPTKLSSAQKAAVRAQLTADFQQSFSYDLYGLIGQSNARGGGAIGSIQSEYTTNDPNSDIQFWDGTRFGDLDINAPNYQFPASGTAFGPVFSFATDLVADNDTSVYIQMHAVGGSALGTPSGAIDDWHVSHNELQFDYRIERSMIRVEATANNITLNEKGTIWMQGVRDSEVEALALAYEANLNDLFDSLSVLLSEPKFLIVKTSILLDISGHAFRDTVRAAQQAVADARADTQIISTDDLTMPSDHYLPAGIEIIGQRIFAVIKDW